MVSVMIFTLDEEVNLPHCLDALAWCDDVIVVDSFSVDRTAEISRERGARLFTRKFDGFGSQRNWALENTHPKYPWILILDADERVTAELAQELGAIAAEDPRDVGAWRVRRRFHMWGRWLRYSSLYPTWVVRFVRLGRVSYVNRGHAETQVVAGEVRDLRHDLIDENHKGIDEWFERHNRYSSQDARHELQNESSGLRLAELFSRDPLARRAALKRVAGRIPARGLAYFLYSYVWRRGFLDGRAGLTFCFMRAMYQSTVAVKKLDIKRSRAIAPRDGPPT